MVDGFNLEELDNVVGNGEDDDGQDVAEPVVHVQLQNENNFVINSKALLMNFKLIIHY